MEFLSKLAQCMCHGLMATIKKKVTCSIHCKTHFRFGWEGGGALYNIRMQRSTRVHQGHFKTEEKKCTICSRVICTFRGVTSS